MKDMTAALIIRKQDNRILLVHNTKHNGLRIEPPGGKREGDEDLESCIVREVREELNIGIKPTRLFGIYETNSPEGKFRVYMYWARVVSGEPRVLEPDKISAFGWYNLTDIEKFQDEGVLVPNLVSALNDLRKYLR